MKNTPERLFQFMILEEPSAAVRTTAAFERNVVSLKETYPDARYELYDNETVADFLSGTYPREVLQAYETLTPCAFKADLARYCLLHTYGGLYSDLAYLHLRPIRLEQRHTMAVFRDIAGHPSWSVSNGLIYARRGSDILARAIERVLENYRARFYGKASLEPTGPYMFGRILAETDNWTSISFGDSSVLNAGRSGPPDIVNTTAAGEAVAMRVKTRDGQITDFVTAGSNDYNLLWSERRIWGESRTTSAYQRLRSKFTIS